MSWIRVWLSCAAFFYPLCWTCASITGAAPALFRVALLGHRLEYFGTSPFGATAMSIPRNFAGELKPGVQYPDPYALLAVGLVVVAIVRLRSRSPLGGLAVALLGQIPLLPLLWRLWFWRRLDTAAVSESLFFFGVLCLGLRRMLAGWVPNGYWARADTLLAAFHLPLAVMGGLLTRFRFPREIWLLMIPGAIASLLVSWPRRRDASSEPLRIGWKPAAMGLAATLLLTFGAPRAGQALQLAQRRAQLEASRAAMAAFPEIPPDLPYPKVFFQKGVNFTADFPDSYISERARQMLGLLPKYGVNAVALVPYANATRNPPGVRVNTGINTLESDEGLEQLSRVAHHLGIKVLLKPHVGGRINLDFSSAEDRAKWFAQYALLVEHYAQLAKRIHADVFCVGAEFVKLSRYDAEWRKLIARARELYAGPLVYAANFGGDFEGVTFWDALDYIGLDNYYPLPDDLSTEAIVRKIEAVAAKFQKPVIFTEAGFSSYEAPHRQPWDDRPRKLSPQEQARCYEALFRAFHHQAWFQGVYWWKVGASGSGGPQDGSHTPWGKPAMDRRSVLRVLPGEPKLRIERTSSGDIVIKAPEGWGSGHRGLRLVVQLDIWARRDRTGVAALQPPVDIPSMTDSLDHDKAILRLDPIDYPVVAADLDSIALLLSTAFLDARWK